MSFVNAIWPKSLLYVLHKLTLLHLRKLQQNTVATEWRPSGYRAATQRLWFDGSAVPCARPQNVPGMQVHFMYRGSAPIFATGKLDDIEELQKDGTVDPSTGKPLSSEASMLLRRLKVYPYRVRIPKPPSTCHCGRCFASLVLGQRAVSQ